MNDPLLAPLRKDPAFAAFIGGVEARAALIGIEEICDLSMTPPRSPLDGAASDVNKLNTAAANR